MAFQIETKMFMKEIDQKIEKEAHNYAIYHHKNNKKEYKLFYDYFIKTAKSDENLQTLKHNYVLTALRQKYPDAITCQFKFDVRDDDEYINISNVSITPIHELRLTSFDLDEYITLHPDEIKKTKNNNHDNHIIWMNTHETYEDQVEVFIYNVITNYITTLIMKPNDMVVYHLTDLAKEHLAYLKNLKIIL